MSHKATVWAWEQPAENSGQKLVLLALADAAGGDEDDERICWPSVERISRMTGIGASTVRKHLDRLVVIGLLVKLQRRRRCNGTLGTWRYVVMFTTADTAALDVEPPLTQERTSADPSAVVHRSPSGAHEPSVLNQQEEPTRSLLPQFDAFWEPYPKKVGKGEARIVFDKLNAADKSAAIEGAARHAECIRANPEVFVLPDGPVWLNKRRWEDEEPRRRPDRTATVTRPSRLERLRAMRQTQMETGT
jgi:hypothetical protein